MSADAPNVDFCPSCFATSENGSWNHVVVGNYCTNCGTMGGIVQLPLPAVEEIRRNASWVGKRYYPCDEDVANREELAKLRGKMTEYPGRSVELREGAGYVETIYMVTQKLPKGRSVSVFVNADTPEQAHEKTRTSLPYVEASEL